MRGEFDIVIFLTGVGMRTLVRAIEATYSREAIVSALTRTKVVARGPKPLAALRELGVPVWVAVPEPNTWREVVAALDAKAQEVSLAGARIAVQEYGVTNTELLDALRARGAQVTSVPVYQWALPEDVAPLKRAVKDLCDNKVDVVLLTTSVQIVHLWQVAREMGLERDVQRGLARSVIASIGPTTTEALRRHELAPDLEATHGKMGILVREAAEQSADLLRSKRGGVSGES
jgi:uroporphyrinogen-III synthase